MAYAAMNLQAFTPNISGMAHNGIDNIPKEGTWLLDGGERVLNPEQNKDLTRYLQNNKGGNGVNVTINVPPGFTARQTRSQDGVTIDVVEQVVAEKFNNVRRSNSQESRVFQDTFGLAPVR